MLIDRMVRHVPALLAGSLILSAPLFANAQPAVAAPVAAPAPAPAPAAPAATPAAKDVEPAPALILPTDWCTLPLCRDAEGLRRSGDLTGALKLYRYIQEEVDVDEKVLRKPLLWYAIAVLHLELHQPQQGQDALAKYQLYVSPLADSDLPAGQRREDIERLAQELRNVMGRLRIVSKSAGTHVVVDGKEIGVTPLPDALPITPGAHRVQIAGSYAEVQDVDVPSGQEVVLWPLQPPPAPPAPPPIYINNASHQAIGKERRPAWRIGVGVLGMASGITMISFGAASLVSNGHCSSGAPAGQCPIESGSSGLPVTRVVDGRAAGGGLIAGGIVLSAVGAVLVALPAKRRPVTAAISFTNGANLRLATTF